MAERGRASTDAGFTLLEMLVALAVFSLAALALVRLQAVAVRTAADLDERQMAGLVAHNLMVDVQTSPDMLVAGDSQGELVNGGRRWRWARRVSKTGDEAVYRVDIRVEGAGLAASPAVLTFLKVQS